MGSRQRHVACFRLDEVTFDIDAKIKILVADILCPVDVVLSRDTDRTSFADELGSQDYVTSRDVEESSLRSAWQ